MQVNNQSEGLDGPLINRAVGLNWHNHQHSKADYVDEKPLLVVTSASVPSSPSLPRIGFEFVDSEEAAFEKVSSIISFQSICCTNALYIHLDM